MKYYLHDSSAFQDEKITELYINFGYEGLGLFYTILEKIALQEKPVKTIVLKRQLNVGKKLEKCWSFMESIGLISSNNGETFNEQLLKFSEKYQIKKEKNKERISQWRENQSNTEKVTRYESVSNTPKDNINKVKESKEKGSKPKQTIFRESIFFDFEKFESSFAATDYEIFNLKYYYEAVLSWSDSSGAKKLDWIATARGFMARDAKDGKAAFKDQNLTQNGNRTGTKPQSGTIRNEAAKRELFNKFSGNSGDS